MSDEWITVRLDDIVKVKGGKRLPAGCSLIPIPNQHPYIRLVDFNGRKVKLTNDFQYVPDDIFPLIKRYIAQEGDILISIVGTIGLVAIVDDSLHEANLTENAVKLVDIAENVDRLFLYYFLTSPKGQQEINKRVVGSTQPKLPIYNIKDIRLLLPPLTTQNRIAEILGTLDDKIECNRRIHQTLEATAQALYKHWFVDFGPFRDSEFVESELGQIPNGWSVKTVADFGSVVCGKTPATADLSNFGDDYPFITIPDMRNQIYALKTARRLSKKGADSQKGKYVPVNSICVSCIATPGLVVLTSETSQTNQQINTIIPERPEAVEFLYLAMKEKGEHIQLLGSGGTATLNLNTGDFSRMKLISPHQRVLQEFHIKCSNLFASILLAQRETETLIETRDYLLPKLLSSEVEVKSVEEAVKAV